MNYVIKVTPKDKKYKPHIWKEGGEFFSEEGAEFHAKQMRNMKNFYKEVKVVLNPVRYN